MSMTRRDFDVLAKAIREAREAGAHGKAVGQIIGKVADALRSNYPNFDRPRFITACRPVAEEAQTVSEPTVAPTPESFTYLHRTYRVGDRISYRDHARGTIYATITSFLPRSEPSAQQVVVDWENSDRINRLWLNDEEVNIAPRVARPTVPTGGAFRVGDTVRVPDGAGCCGRTEGRIVNVDGERAFVVYSCGGGNDVPLADLQLVEQPQTV